MTHGLKLQRQPENSTTDQLSKGNMFLRREESDNLMRAAASGTKKDTMFPLSFTIGI